MTAEIAEDSSRDCDRVEIHAGFRWDACGAYLFDIDGTLVHAQGGVHMDAFSSSVFEIMGHPLSLDNVVVHGNTDTGILRDAFRGAAVADDVWRPKQEEILERMRATVIRRQHLMKVVVHPGVVKTLAHLRRRGCALGVATGNLEQIGWLKIELAGLREWFSFGSFSDRHALRSEMIRHAAIQAREIAGEHASVCVVGDTPSDIAAAKANSLHTIAVATGIYSCSELLQHQPEVCTSTLEALLRHTAPEGETH
jgi:phosphoglycolate phosphatase-like HAD superfamily hydrolase